MNNSQVALPTGQEVKLSLSEGGDRPDIEPHLHHLWKRDVAATKEECEPQEFIQLHGDGVIGEVISDLLQPWKRSTVSTIVGNPVRGRG